MSDIRCGQCGAPIGTGAVHSCAGLTAAATYQPFTQRMTTAPAPRAATPEDDVKRRAVAAATRIMATVQYMGAKTAYGWPTEIEGFAQVIAQEFRAAPPEPDAGDRPAWHRDDPANNRACDGHGSIWHFDCLRCVAASQAAEVDDLKHDNGRLYASLNGEANARIEAEAKVESLAAALAESRREVARYEGTEGRCPVGHNKRFTYQLSGAIGCVACDRDKAQQEVAGLRRDAERYRWLRANATDRNVWQPIDAPERFDAAVDKAIAADTRIDARIDAAIDAAKDAAETGSAPPKGTEEQKA